MGDIAIRVDNLGKQYRIGSSQAHYKTIRESLVEMAAAPYHRLRAVLRGHSSAASDEMIWALRNVSFEIERGEVVGVIGRNGAGKSTLLKILSRITEPTEGWAEIHGRVGSLLDVGTGFHPELTGRENIYLSGAILGMRRAEIDLKFDEIVAFAEVERFIDTPVKHYSSGMYLRLAFAVAAHLEPEILLVQQGRTVLLVSHNMASIQSLCTRCCLLDAGHLVHIGDTREVVDEYVRSSINSAGANNLATRRDRRGNGTLRFTGIQLRDGQGNKVAMGRTGDPLNVVISYDRSPNFGPEGVICIRLANALGQDLFQFPSRMSRKAALDFSQGSQVVCHIPRLPLLPGRYSVSLWCKDHVALADQLADALWMDIVAGDFYGTGKLNPPDGGDVIVDHSWEICQRLSDLG